MAQSRRCFTLDRDVSRMLDAAAPPGHRSALVNDALRAALKRIRATHERTATVAALCAALSALAALAVAWGAQAA